MFRGLGLRGSGFGVLGIRVIMANPMEKKMDNDGNWDYRVCRVYIGVT